MGLFSYLHSRSNSLHTEKPYTNPIMISSNFRGILPTAMGLPDVFTYCNDVARTLRMQ